MSMKRLPLRSLHRECTLLAVLCLGVLAGCGRENIRVYSVPKERPTLAEGEPGGQPHIRWKLPAGWDKDFPVYKPSDGPVATRTIGGKVMNIIAEKIPTLTSGSADLNESTFTK